MDRSAYGAKNCNIPLPGNLLLLVRMCLSGSTIIIMCSAAWVTLVRYG